jgi:phosphoglucomutase
VVCIEDYKTSIAKDLKNNTEKQINIEKSNVLIFYTEDGSKIAVRPSGTEPKIKFYFGVKADLKNVKNYKQVENQLDEKINRIKKDLGL